MFSEEDESLWATPFEWEEGPFAVTAEREGLVDHSRGLQSSSFMEERIWKADSIVSSRCFCPSIASSCVVLGFVDDAFASLSSILLDPSTEMNSAAQERRRKWFGKSAKGDGDMESWMSSFK